MPRGGLRPRAGRPKKGTGAQATQAAPGAQPQPAPAYTDPKAYLFDLMNDAGADPRRRDWAVGVLMGYVHPKPATVVGSPPKQQAQRQRLIDERGLRDDFEQKAKIIRGRFGAT